MKKSIKYWFGKVFVKDVNIGKKSFFYLFFSFLAVILIVEFFIFEYFVKMKIGFTREIPAIIILFIISLIFLLSGFLVDIIKDKTRLYIITLSICIIGLYLSTFSYPLTKSISLVIILITIPQLIIVWFSTLVHETNILNRGRITAFLLTTCFLIGLTGLIFIFYKDLFIFFIIIEIIFLNIIIWFSRTYRYVETEKRLKSDKKYLKLIFEKHFSRYSITFAFLSGLLGGLLYNSLKCFSRYEIDIIAFSVISFFYVIAAGWFFDNVGRKNTLVIGILIVSFFYISHSSFYLQDAELVFWIPIKIHISIHYAFAILPLILAIITISGDFSTERGNLKYRGRINGLFMSLMCFGLALGYILYRMIDVLYENTDIAKYLPNLPNLFNSFVIVIVLVWMMAGKDILVSKERDWAKTLKSLFIFSTSGVCIYNHSFIQKYQTKEEENECEIDEDLISGALSGIITIISEITRSKKHIKKIDKEGNHLFFAFGKYHIAALITTTDLPVLFKKLDNFSQEFGQIFSKDLKRFQGNVQKFASTKYIIRKYFSQKYSEFL